MPGSWEQAWKEVGDAVLWFLLSMPPGPAPGYAVPTDVMLVLATATAGAVDGVRLAATAEKSGDLPALVTALQYTLVRLDLIHETLLAVVSEHDRRADGTERAC